MGQLHVLTQERFVPREEEAMAVRGSGETFGERIARIEERTESHHKENQRAMGEIRDAIQTIISTERTDLRDMKALVAELEDDLAKLKDKSTLWEGRGQGAAWATRIGWGVIVAALMAAEFVLLKLPHLGK